MVDTLRADRLGAYGNRGGHTPRLDALAAQSALFEHAVAASPWTQPSVATLFCGCHPEVHGVTGLPASARDATLRVKALPFHIETLAEKLARAGYTTAAFVANPFVSKRLGFAQGFSVFEAGFASNTTPGEVLNRAAAEWLARRPRHRPFFLYLHYMDVHGPYVAPDEVLDPLLRKVEAQAHRHVLGEKELARLGYLGVPPPGTRELERHRRLMRYREYWVARYDAGVRVFDRVWEDLRTRLEGLGTWDQLLVILLADHGEALCERGWWDHGVSLHEEELHVPLLVRWPGVVEAGRRVHGTVSLADVAPTILELAGLSPGSGMQGRSLASYLSTGRPTAVDPRPVRAGAVKLGRQRAIFHDPWKLIRDEDRSVHSLFRLSGGREEPVDADAHPGLTARLHRELDALLAAGRRLAAGRAASETGLSESARERLRALGYLE